MPVAIHVGIRVLRHIAGNQERIFPAPRGQHRLQHEDADDDAMADEFVRDHGLHEHREHDEAENQRQGDEVQFLDVLPHFVVVVAGQGLHQNTDQNGNAQ